MGRVVVTGFEVVEPMVDGRSARVRVSVHNEATPMPAAGDPDQVRTARLDAGEATRLQFRAVAARGGDGAREAAVLALRAQDDDHTAGWGRLSEGQERTFELLVDPNGSPPGAVFDLVVSYRDGGGFRTASVAHERIVTRIHHDPRPEVLALLGLAARVQDLASTAYTLLKKEGQTIHRRQATTMPTTPTDAVGTVLDRDNYNWVLRGVEVGTQLFNLRRNASRGDSDRNGGGSR